jgi:hypothetical protein
VLHGSIPIRLGVAHGLFVFNGSEGLFVGPPLVRAHDLGEAAQWIGAVLDDTVADRAQELKPEFSDALGLPLVVEWNVRVKSSSAVKLPVLAWPRSHRRNFSIQPPISVEDFYRAFEQLFGPLSGLRAQERGKYDNTVAFVNAMLSS